MNQPKYQIFVSSTYKDLKDERDAVIKSILEIGHIPVGMEMFSAGDEEQWQLIQRTIDDCDYYLVIIGGKYGSMDGDISYTEKEYDYAKSKGIPALGFVMNYDENISINKVEKDATKSQKLEEFKRKVQGKMVNYWKNKDELSARVLAALTKQFNVNPQVGWIRGDNQPNAHVLEEISRLSNQNDIYRKQIEDLIFEGKDNESMMLNKVLEKAQLKIIIYRPHPLKELHESISYLNCLESIYFDTLYFTSLQNIKNCICKSAEIPINSYIGNSTFDEEFKRFWTFMLSQELVYQKDSFEYSIYESIDEIDIWSITDKCKKVFMESQLLKFSNEINSLPK